MKKSLIIGKREYLKVVRKPAFWIATLILPIFIVAVSILSGISSSQFKDEITSSQNNIKLILVMDQSGYIRSDKIVKPIQRENDKSDGINKVKQNQADAFVYISPDFSKTKQIEVYQQDKGLILSSRYNDFISSVIKDSILSELNDQAKKEIFNSSYNFNVTSYKDGQLSTTSIADLIIPGIAVVVYFLLTTLATSYLLLSISEEKENRVMEIVLSTVEPRELITGKIIGLLGVVFTQLIVLVLLSMVGLLLAKGLFSDAIDLSQLSSSGIHIDLPSLILWIFYTLIGFFILACTMVGVGSAMPTYREAQGFSSIFIILSIFPVYFITIILAQPSGNIATIFFFFSYSTSIILIFRTALNAITLPEIIGSIILLLIYAYLALIMAFKLFEIGSLEYNKRITLKSLFSKNTTK